MLLFPGLTHLSLSLHATSISRLTVPIILKHTPLLLTTRLWKQSLFGTQRATRQMQQLVFSLLPTNSTFMILSQTQQQLHRQVTLVYTLKNLPCIFQNHIPHFQNGLASTVKTMVASWLNMLILLLLNF